MKIKENSQTITWLELLGTKETSLCKAFAFLIATDKNAFIAIMRDVFGIKKANYEKSIIKLETQYEDIGGRTDIEIDIPGHHIILEAKIRNNRVGKEQNQKYVNCPQNTNCVSTLCFITENQDSNVIIPGTQIIYRSWTDIIMALENISKEPTPEIKNFLDYYERIFKMQNVKEVLVRDISKETEINRFMDNKVYMCNPQFGTPLYFAPYFTKSVKGDKKDGIFYFAEVCGVITGNKDSMEDIIKAAKHEDGPLMLYAKKYNSDESDAGKKARMEIIEKWVKGIETTSDNKTYYFLGETIPLKHVFKKDTGINKGRGKGWIAAAIPQNRCIPFKEFMRRI